MPILEDAATLLRQTEKKLRDMVSAAATSGDYTSVMQIASWAQGLTALMNGRSAKPAVAVGSGLPDKNGKIAKATAIQTRTSRRPGTDYPQFFKHDGQLLRLAWSKRQKKEYVHKAPYAVLKSLVNSMAEHGADGRVFSTYEFLPLVEKPGGDAAPDYQAYVSIALLKQSGLIDQHGRQGYSIPRLADFKNAVEAVWKKLPERQGS